jgi:release factor glutamine methyltransferase
MNAWDIRLAVRKILHDAGVHEVNFEADQIICHETRLSRASLHSRHEASVADEVIEAVTKLAHKRARGEPLSYVLGSALFCGRRFLVRSGVLVPRPETEIMTDLASDIMRESNEPDARKNFADWCTGSGCIAITLLLENREWMCFAVDSSRDALAVAEENAALHGVRDRINFVLCDEPESSGIEAGSLDFVITNPPYIPTACIAALESQVRDYEPRESLDGGSDGMDVYRILFGGLPGVMKPDSPLLMETGGDEQTDELIGLGESLSDRAKRPCGLTFVKKFFDHRGIGRFMLWKNKNHALK